MAKIGMRNFQDTFKTRKQSLISAFSICITGPLTNKIEINEVNIALKEIQLKGIGLRKQQKGESLLWMKLLKRS